MKHTMRCLILLFGLMACDGPSPEVGAELCARFGLPEAIESNRDMHDHAVYYGCEALADDDLQRAQHMFWYASQVDSFEVPNYYELPILAWLEWKIGEADQARVTIRIAELAYRVELGELACRMGEDGVFGLVETGFPDDIERLAAHRICGEAFAPLNDHGREKLATALVELLKIKTQIGSSAE